MAEPPPPLDTPPAKDDNDEELDLLIAGQERNHRLMWSLVGLYVVLLIVVGIVTFFSFRRITRLQESTISKMGKSASDIATAAKDSGFLTKILKSGSDFFQASAEKAVADMKKESSFRRKKK